MSIMSHQERVEFASVQPRPRRRINYNRLGVILLFLSPGAVLYTIFVVLPVGQAAYFSLFRWNGLGPISNFGGLDNFAKAFNDPVFIGALSHGLFFIVMSILIQLPLALALALLVGRRLPGRSLFRVLFFLPYVLSDVIAAVIWGFLLQPEGAFNGLLKIFIPGFESQAWLGDTNLVLFAIFIVLSWKFIGFHMTLYITGLQQIPQEIEEAAIIDGANAAQSLRYITLPLLSNTIRLTIYLSVLGALHNFELVFLMTGGGPVNSSETITTYLYNFGFKRFQIGYGSAVAVILFIICFSFSLIYQRYALSRNFNDN
jgi:raffinose/stachyose/melibiose transport system permease protein